MLEQFLFFNKLKRLLIILFCEEIERKKSITIKYYKMLV